MVNQLPYERYLLACILNEPQTVWEVSSILAPKDFHYAANAYIFARCKELVEADKDIDIMSIYNGFTKEIQKVVDAADSKGNGVHYIDVLKKSPFSLQNLQENVNIIKASSVRKELALLFDNLRDKMEHNDGLLDVNEVVESALKQIVNSAFSENDKYSSGQIAEGLREFLVERMNNPVPILGYKSGFPKFDEAINGLQPGKLLVVAARPKIGKSTLLLNWAKFLSVDQKIPVLYLDTEMSAAEQQSRLLSMISSVEEKKILNGLFARSKVDMDRVEKAVPILEKAPFYHMYMPDFTLEKVIAYARKYKIQYNIGALILDYIKLPDLTNLAHTTEWQELGTLTNGLKNKVAGKLDIPVLTAGQLNRKGADPAYMGTDQIAGSDRILHYANYVLSLREKTVEEYSNENGRRGNRVLTILASRSSEDGIAFDLMFKKPTLQMTEMGAHKFEELEFDIEG